MTIDASLENIVLELERRWRAIVTQGGPLPGAMAIILKNTILKNLVCGNMYKTLCGERNAGVQMSVARLAKGLVPGDLATILAGNRALTAQMLFVLALAGKVKQTGKLQRMINDFIAESEAGLHRLYLIEKRSRAARAP